MAIQGPYPFKMFNTEQVITYLFNCTLEALFEKIFAILSMPQLLYVVLCRGDDKESLQYETVFCDKALRYKVSHIMVEGIM